MTDVTGLTATGQLAALRAGEMSAVDLMQATLTRIGGVNPRLNAIVSLRDTDALMAEARAADAGPVRGPLHGLPIAVKDLDNVAGIRSTQGSPLFADFVPDKDDLVPARLRAAGAIVIGKTNTPEFGLGSHTFNPVHGETLNPYDTSKSCGGSSGGAAVALATGMVALADGSDMMGSLRNPAGWNNVYGFRPTWGRVPAKPDGDLFLHQLSTHGPMARAPQDLALLLDVMSGADAAVPLSRDTSAIAPLHPARPDGLRIGWLADWGGAFPTEAGILTLCQRALDAFADLGCHVSDLTPGFDSERIWRSWVTLRAFAVSASLAPLADRRAALKDSAQWELDLGRSLTASDIHAASADRSEWYRYINTLFDEFDVLALPTAQVWPFASRVPYPERIEGVEMDTYHRWMQVMTPVSLIGLPSLAVPAGFGEQGLAMGLQLFGRHGSDAGLLQLGEAYHRATGWPEGHRPPV